MIAEFRRAAAPDASRIYSTRCATRHNVPVLKTLLCAALSLLALVGCAVGPERDARGNPKIERLTEEALARLPAPEPKLTAEDLVRLSREGMQPEKIIERFQATHSRLRMPRSEIMELGKQGVDRKVLDTLAEAEERARQTDVAESLARRDAEQAQLEEQRRELYRYHFNPHWPYPPYWGGTMGVPRRNWGFYGYW
jgi:hypothetical protein